MANAGEELTTDSVPDPPRVEIHDDDDVGHNSDSDNSSERGSSAKGQTSGNKTPPAQGKKRRNSKPNSKPQSSFGIPRINTPGAANMICINNASNIHIGNNISINVVGQAYSQRSASKSPSPEPRSTEKSQEVKDACKSTAPVLVEDLDTVTEHVGSRWTKLGERLGYSKEQMEQFHEDHHGMGLKEVVYQMLLDWKQYKGAEAQVGLLCHCLWSARLYLAAEKLAARHSGKSL
ncbi:Protein immune deficiency [Gryllus bimaculatus]|uniref:Immune deficiency n=1 Tax=Gryllus bimaculatus TaxID=6999 RepID=A0A455R6B4_GRYBI|nr:immune deficiency [Gryllus bimaculatus]GLH13762.1 Protein immune deficiency [Gryllus bimaculatus]